MLGFVPSAVATVLNIPPSIVPVGIVIVIVVVIVVVNFAALVIPVIVIYTVVIDYRGSGFRLGIFVVRGGVGIASPSVVTAIATVVPVIIIIIIFVYSIKIKITSSVMRTPVTAFGSYLSTHRLLIDRWQGPGHHHNAAEKPPQRESAPSLKRRCRHSQEYHPNF